MPIIRKIIDVGKTSRGIILPKSWLEYYEKEQGKPIETVAIEVNKKLTIEPYIEKDESASAQSRERGRGGLLTNESS